MQVVWLVETLESCELFNEAHWFTTLVVSFTAACLVLFVMSNESDPTLEETKDAVRRMKSLCHRHSGQSASMQRCYMFLEVTSLLLQCLLGRTLIDDRIFIRTSLARKAKAHHHLIRGAVKSRTRSPKLIACLTMRDWNLNRILCKR